MDSEFQIGDWGVDVPRNRLVRSDHPEHSVRIEPKAMQVLVYLAQHAGEVVEKETVVKEVWEGPSLPTKCSPMRFGSSERPWAMIPSARSSFKLSPARATG